MQYTGGQENCALKRTGDPDIKFVLIPIKMVHIISGFKWKESKFRVWRMEVCKICLIFNS